MATLILKDDIPHEQVGEIMRKLGLELEVPSDDPSELPEDLFLQTWQTPDRQSSVQFIDDSFTQVHSVSTLGAEEDALADKLEEALPVWEWGRLLSHAEALRKDGSDSARQRVAYEVAFEMNGNGFDPAGAEVLNAFLQESKPSIRLAGARAFRVLNWRRFRLMAERLAADSDPAIAEEGDIWLEDIRELHGDEQPNPMTDSLFGSNGDGTFGSWLPAGEQRKESGEE